METFFSRRFDKKSKKREQDKYKRTTKQNTFSPHKILYVDLCHDSSRALNPMPSDSELTALKL